MTIIGVLDPTIPSGVAMMKQLRIAVRTFLPGIANLILWNPESLAFVVISRVCVLFGDTWLAKR